MQSPTFPAARAKRPHSPVHTLLIRGMALCALALAALGASATRADATLTYELSEAGKDPVVKQLSMARFFIRIDDPADSERYLLYQAGKFFPLFSVDTAAGTYTRLTPPVTPYMSPESRNHHGADNKTVQRGQQAPVLKPTRKERTVNGIRCRVIHELQDGKPVIEHCMANSARLGVTDRDLVNLARVFAMARERGFGWLGTGTKDETFASVASRDLRDDRQLTLTAITRTPQPGGYLRIPREYREVSANTPDEKATALSTEDDDRGDDQDEGHTADTNDPASHDDATTAPAGKEDDDTPDEADSDEPLSVAPGAATADRSPAPQTGTVAAP